jgi:competence protein ComEC
LFGGLITFSTNHYQKTIRENEQYVANHADFKGSVEVISDTIKVDGNLLQFQCLTQDKKKIAAIYQLKSEKDKISWQKTDGKLKLQVTGELTKGTSLRNLGGFDYSAYLKQMKFTGALSVKEISQVQVDNPHWFQIIQKLHNVRRKIILYIDGQFQNPMRNYIKALIFGYSDADFSQMNELFKKLGVIHLFCLSGMHVVFFFGILRYFCLRIGIRVEYTRGILLIFSVFFAGVTGFGISIMRAVIQKDIEIGKEIFRLPLNSQDLFAITLLIGLINMPSLLQTSSGQLSYALGFIILFVAKSTAQIKSTLKRELAFSLVLSIAILPIVWWNFYEWNPLAIVLTFFLNYFFDFVLIPGLCIALLTQRVFPPFNDLLNLILKLFEKLIVGFENGFEFNWTIGKPVVVIFLIMIVSGIFIIHYSETSVLKKQWIPLSLLGLSVIVTLHPINGIVAVVDIGQGDSIFIEEPFARKKILIDCGGRMEFKRENWQIRAKGSANAENTLIPFLKSRGVRTLDEVYITHSDEDHTGDLLSLAKSVKIKKLYFGAGAYKKKMFYQQLCQLQKSGVKLQELMGPRQINDFSLLRPTEVGSGTNNDSLVMLRTIKGTRFLFTGDTEKEGEQALTKQYPNLKIDVLKVGHHGSRTSTTNDFVASLKPKVALISCGVNNRFHHPRPETIDTLQNNGVKIFRTDEQGMLYYEWSPIKSTLSPIQMTKD